MKGNYDDAKRKLEELKEIVTGESNPKKFNGYHNLMGMTSLMSGNAEKGVEHFEKVVDQSNIYFQYHKGLAYKASGDLDKAKEFFQSVATHNFNGLNYTAVRNRALKELGQG
jgi:tetratricopeptide (TPR) repeat protein